MPSTVAIIGGGVIGSGWAARFLLHGWNVRLFDPEPAARARVQEVLDRARLSLPGLGNVSLPPEGELHFPGLMSEAVAGADWVQESIPERLELKQKVFQTLQEHMDPGAILASSTSGFTPSELQATSARPEQIVVAHPFNPVYLLPLVELVGTDRNGAARMARAQEVLTRIGMYPLRVRSELPAHLADRLMDAVWREAICLIRDGHATTEEVDNAIRMGFGLRWAQMGVFETHRIAGGAGGTPPFAEQLITGAKGPGHRLVDAPDADGTLARTLAEQSQDQSGQHDIGALEAQRDRNLVGIMRSLAGEDWGAGAVLRGHDQALAEQLGLPDSFAAIADLSRPIVTVDRAVPLDWLDRNDHMTLAAYMQVFSDAIFKTLALLGCDKAYADQHDRSFFTVDSHVCNKAEARAGAPLRVETRILDGGGRKLKLWHALYSGDQLLATALHLLVHVDMQTRRACDMDPALAGRVARIIAAQACLPDPQAIAL